MGGYIPEGELFDTFRTLAKMVRNFYTQIFQYWDCPIAISNGYTECVNRLIRESNMKGRGCSFETLRGRSLYCKTNLLNIINNVGISIGPNPRRRRVVHHRGRKRERRGRRMGDRSPSLNTKWMRSPVKYSANGKSLVETETWFERFFNQLFSLKSEEIAISQRQLFNQRFYIPDFTGKVI
ncbi:MAG: transposase [Bifidobacterium longum]|nr:transposase [Bifidobacterium longum]